MGGGIVAQLGRGATMRNKQDRTNTKREETL